MQLVSTAWTVHQNKSQEMLARHRPSSALEGTKDLPQEPQCILRSTSLTEFHHSRVLEANNKNGSILTGRQSWRTDCQIHRLGAQRGHAPFAA